MMTVQGIKTMKMLQQVKAISTEWLLTCVSVSLVHFALFVYHLKPDEMLHNTDSKIVPLPVSKSPKPVCYLIKVLETKLMVSIIFHFYNIIILYKVHFFGPSMCGLTQSSQLEGARAARAAALGPWRMRVDALAGIVWP